VTCKKIIMSYYRSVRNKRSWCPTPSTPVGVVVVGVVVGGGGGVVAIGSVLVIGRTRSYSMVYYELLKFWPRVSAAIRDTVPITISFELWYF